MIIITFSYIMRITCNFNLTVIITYSPPMTIDDGYHQTIFSDLFASDKMYWRREYNLKNIFVLEKSMSLHAGTFS